MLKRIPLLLIFIFLLYGADLLAQPANDECANPTTITDLDGSCITYNTVDATFDVVQGSCFIGTDVPNVWFSFVADGPTVSVDWDNFGAGNRMNIALAEVTDCSVAGITQLQCGSALPGQIINFTGLVTGNTYYFFVSLPTMTGSFEGDFEMCVTNLESSAPANDDACDATVITANGTCNDGTTIDATGDFAGNFSTCVDPPDQGVFFVFTATAGNVLAEIDINNLGGPGEYTVAFGQFLSGCNDAFTFNPDVFCGDSGTDIIGDAYIEPGEQYYIYVATTEANEGQFELCVTQIGPPPGCSANNSCNTAETIGGIVSGAGPSCVDGCNTLASPGGIDGLGCNLTIEETVWYEFTTDALANFASIQVTSTEIDDPIVQVFQWNCSGSPTAVGGCTTGSNGELEVLDLNVAANTTYLIAVSNEFGEGGNFELCVLTFEDGSSCATETSLEVVPGSPSLGSPDDGPYLPGESVTYRFRIDNYHADPVGSGNNCQWLQGIVPIFGNGWDTNSFNGADFTVSQQYAGVWSWYAQAALSYQSTSIIYEIEDLDMDGDIDICTINDFDCAGDGVAPGDPMPAGWFASQGAGNPNFTFGDGGCCSCDMPGPNEAWEVVFTISTLEYVECSGPPEETDLSVRVFTFADGETGSWANPNVESICGQDNPQSVSRTLNCCLGPEALPETATVCPGDALGIVLETDPPNPDATYSWVVQNSGNTSGAMDGAGQVIGDVITNNTTSTQTVTYLVTAIDDSGCPGEETQVIVTILPAIDVDAGDDIDGCTGVNAVLGGSPTATGGGGLFTYDWGDASVDNIANPTVSPSLSSIFVLTVTDNNGCSSTDEVELFINPSFDVEIEGDTALCFNDLETTLTASPQGGTPNYMFDWNGAGINGFPGQILNYNGGLVGPGDYVMTVTVTDNFGCTGETEIGINILQEPTLFIVSSPESAQFCPGGSVMLQAAAVNGEFGVTYSYDWITPTGGFLNGQTINVTEAGEYILEVTDDLLGCLIEGTITVEEVLPPEPVIVAPQGLCNNDEVFIGTEIEYEEYLWDTGETTDSIFVGPGSYSVTVTSAAGCTGEEVITINPLADPAVTISGSSTFCVGSSSILSVSDQFSTFEWTDEAGNVIGDTDTLFVTDEDTYNVLVTDMNGCSATSLIEVTIQDFLVPNIAGDTSICPAACSELDAGSGYVSYEWSTTEVTQMITVCDPGTYSVTVYDAGGCTGEQIKTITVNDLPTPQILGDNNLTSFCPGGNLQLDAGSGYTAYEWSTTEGNQNITVSEEGTYSVTVTDAEGCTGETTIDVTLNTPPTPDFGGSTTFCPGDSVLITPEGGYAMYEIDLDNNGVFDVNTMTNDPFYVSAVGFSNIVVTDANGCTGSVIVEVNEFSLPSPQASSDTFSYCTDGSVFIGLTEDFTSIDWYLDNVLVGSGQSIQVSEAGDYLAVVTDENSCLTEATTTVIESTELTPTITGTTAICDNTPITLDAGEGYAIYDWGTLGDSQMIEVTEEGTYTVTVTDAGGCSGEDDIVVTSSTTPVAEVLSAAEICNNSDGDNSSTLDFISFVTGAQGFWSDDSGVGVDLLTDLTSVDFDGVLAGTYEFTYTTSIAIDPCQDVEYTLSIEVGDCLCPSVAVGDLQPICTTAGLIDLDTVQITAEPGTWSVTQGDPAILNGNIVDPANGSAGDYILTFTLDNPQDDCDAFNTVELQIISPPNPGVFDDAEIVCFNEGTMVNLFDLIEGEDGGGEWVETSAITSTGTAFDMTGAFNTTDQFTGTYTFMYTVQGVSPCSSESVEVIVMVEPAPVANAGDDKMLNCDLLIVEIGTDASIGNGLSYGWTELKGEQISNDTDPIVNVDNEGTYVMEVTDLNQCVDTDTVEVTINTDFPDVVTEGNDPFCNNESTGTIVAEATGGDGPYEYSLDNGQTWTDANSFLDLPSGTYTVLVQDQNTCTGEVEIVLDNPDVFVADLGPNIFAANITDTLISLDITGGDENLQAAIWTVNDSIVCEGPECLSYVVNAEGGAEVCVTATNIDGCVDSACIVIRSLDINISYTGNTFTPNDDGNNDVFYIQGGSDIEEVNYFRIYNRWGEQIFSQESFPPNDVSYGWNGKFKGKTLNPGVYVYTYEVSYDNGTTELLFGDVTIVN